jgi:tetratricopeptide (TPR) repeat protein
VWEANALNSVGWFAAHLGDHDTGRDHCRQSLDLYRRHKSAGTSGTADTLHSLGYIEFLSGNHQDAIGYYRQAITLYRVLGYAMPVAGTLHDLGHPHAELGQHDEARAAWEEALKLYRQLGRGTEAERIRQQVDNLRPPEHVAEV